MARTCQPPNHSDGSRSTAHGLKANTELALKVSDETWCNPVSVAKTDPDRQDSLFPPPQVWTETEDL